MEHILIVLPTELMPLPYFAIVDDIVRGANKAAIHCLELTGDVLKDLSVCIREVGR
jgi:hypothetical protein